MEPNKSSVEELLETEHGRCEFAQEELAFEATELISELMEKSGVSKSALAKRTGKSKAHITQVLSGSRNLTMHTLAGLTFALGYQVKFNAVPLSTQTGNVRTMYAVPESPTWEGRTPERVNPAPAPNFLQFSQSHIFVPSA